VSVNLTEQEMKELKSRFSSFVVNENIENDIIVHTLSSGKIVKGSVTVEGVLQIKSVSNFLCG
jgi:hypothetical protein